MAVQPGDSLFHPAEPHVIAGSRLPLRFDRVETAAPITDLDGYRARAVDETNVRPRGAGMLTDVGERLPTYTEQRRFDLLREADRTEVLLVCHNDAVRLEYFDLLAQRRGEPQIIEERGPEPGNDASRLANRLLRR